MNLNWNGEIPLRINCPKCEFYENLREYDWKYIIQRAPEALEDYHICPKCRRVWRILQVHADELSNI